MGQQFFHHASMVLRGLNNRTNPHIDVYRTHTQTSSPQAGVSTPIAGVTKFLEACVAWGRDGLLWLVCGGFRLFGFRRRE